MEKYGDLLVARMESGRKICVCAPYGKTEAGDMIMTTGGVIAQVEKRVPDFDGEVREVVAEFATVHQAQTIWSRYWHRDSDEPKEVQDAEELE